MLGLWSESCPLGGMSALELMVGTGAVGPVWFGLIVGVGSPGRAAQSHLVTASLTYLGCSPSEIRSVVQVWSLCGSCL